LLHAAPFAHSAQLCLKSRKHSWNGSVPPAVAGGYVVDTLDLLMSCEPIHYPPATAGGTDPIHARRLTFEAKPFGAEWYCSRLKLQLELVRKAVS